MTVTIRKTIKTVEELTVDAFEASEVSDKVEYYVKAAKELEERMADLKPLADLVSTMKKELAALADEQAPPEEETYLYGVENKLKYGPKAMTVVAIDKDAAKKALGAKTYFELAEIKVGDLRAYCTPIQLEAILAEERVGARRLKIEKA